MKDGKELAENLEDFVNTSPMDKDAFINGVLGTHRTLQQYIADLMVETLKQIGQQTICDRRNERAVNTGKKISELLEVM